MRPQPSDGTAAGNRLFRIELVYSFGTSSTRRFWARPSGVSWWALDPGDEVPDRAMTGVLSVLADLRFRRTKHSVFA